MTKPCACPTYEAALQSRCHRAGTLMNETLWELCRRSDVSRAQWDRLGLGQMTVRPDAKMKLKTCRHRGRSAKQDGKPVYRLQALG
jgi:hypothetical protein